MSALDIEKLQMRAVGRENQSQDIPAMRETIADLNRRLADATRKYDELRERTGAEAAERATALRGHEQEISGAEGKIVALETQLERFEDENQALRDTFSATLRHLRTLGGVDTSDPVRAVAVTGVIRQIADILGAAVKTETGDSEQQARSAREVHTGSNDAATLEDTGATDEFHPEHLKPSEFTPDLARAFFLEQLVTQKGSTLTAAELYDTYRTWSRERREAPADPDTFNRVFGSLGIEKKTLAGRTRFMDLALKQL